MVIGTRGDGDIGTEVHEHPRVERVGGRGKVTDSPIIAVLCWPAITLTCTAYCPPCACTRSTEICRRTGGLVDLPPLCVELTALEVVAELGARRDAACRRSAVRRAAGTRSASAAGRACLARIFTSASRASHAGRPTAARGARASLPCGGASRGARAAASADPPAPPAPTDAPPIPAAVVVEPDACPPSSLHAATRRATQIPRDRGSVISTWPGARPHGAAITPIARSSPGGRLARQPVARARVGGRAHDRTAGVHAVRPRASEMRART